MDLINFGFLTRIFILDCSDFNVVRGDSVTMMVPQPSRTLDLQRKEELILQKQIRQSTCKVKNNLPTLIGLKIRVEREIEMLIIVFTRGITRF